MITLVLGSLAVKNAVGWIWVFLGIFILGAISGKSEISGNDAAGDLNVIVLLFLIVATIVWLTLFFVHNPFSL